MQGWHAVVFQVPGSEVSIEKFLSESCCWGLMLEGGSQVAMAVGAPPPLRGSGLQAAGDLGPPFASVVSRVSSEDCSSPVTPVPQHPAYAQGANHGAAHWSDVPCCRSPDQSRALLQRRPSGGPDQRESLVAGGISSYRNLRRGFGEQPGAQ